MIQEPSRETKEKRDRNNRDRKSEGVGSRKDIEQTKIKGSCKVLDVMERGL